MRTRTAAVVCGAISGVLTVASLMFPARTVLVPAAALIWPILGGAAAVYLIYRRDKTEVEVDDGIIAGIVAGGVGGLIVAVPFPVWSYFRARSQGATAATVTITGVGGSAVILLIFVILAMVGAFAIVLLSRLLVREKPN